VVEWQGTIVHLSNDALIALQNIKRPYVEPVVSARG
jgi:hypothetical protein